MAPTAATRIWAATRLPLAGLKIFLAAILLAVLLGANGQGKEQAAPQTPNIVVILADDLGWGSLGSYGGAGLKTPYLDRLAKEGRRFTNAYATG